MKKSTKDEFKSKKIVIVGKYRNVDLTGFLQKVVNYLTGLKHEVFLDEDSLSLTGVNYNKADFNQDYDIAIVIGGDGTMMGAARTWGLKGVPLVGINFGRIGFLTDIDKDTVFEKLSEILNGRYQIEEREVLSICITNGKEVVHEETAVNDVVIGKSVSGKLMEFSIFLEDEFVYSQYADGMIVATATGSTAYSLAAGGSIIHPSASVLNIVPICPQNLSNRPLVVSAHNTIKVFFSGKDNIYWAVDGVEPPHVQNGYHFEIKRKQQRVKLMHPEDYSYFQGLRKKLNWSAQ